MAVLGASNQALQALLQSEDTYASVLLAVVVDNYGTESFDWEPETLRMELSDDFGATMPKAVEDRLRALITAITTNQFYRSFELFNETCDVLNGSEADFNTFSPITPEDLAWGVAEVALNDTYSPEFENQDFSEAIKNYAGIILYENGVWQPPSILKFAVMPSGHNMEDVATDAILFEASYALKQEKVAALDKYVQDNVAKLYDQMNKAPLRHREGQLSLA